MIEKLFVYGTLCPGNPNDHILENIGGSWSKASVRGLLHQKGWGAELGYPGIILDKNGDTIEGYIFTSEKLSHHWDELDEFEGQAYKRVMTAVKLIDGVKEEAYIYVLTSD